MRSVHGVGSLWPWHTDSPTSLPLLTGRQPKVFEVRCRACRQLVIMYEVGQRTAVVPGDQAELRRWIREQERDALASDD